MTNPAYSALDQNELIQLALNAGAADDSGAALAYLKEAVARADAGAIAHYLLGAEYAQAGLYDSAIDEMEAALAIDPAMAIVRLQLGLLWLSGGFGDKARSVLGPLRENTPDDYLRLFGEGLLYLIDDRVAEAVELLQSGIVRNDVNHPLNGDMQKIIDAAQAALASAAAEGAAGEAQAEQDGAEDARHVLLSAYMGNVRH